MTLAQETQILSAFLWFMVLMGPPLALALLAPMMYVDGATRGYGQIEVKTDNRAMLLLLFIGFVIWILLLKYLYFPLIGFDTSFLTFEQLPRYNYGDLKSLNTLWTMTLDWIGRSTVPALLLLSFVPLLWAAVLVIARMMGARAASPDIRQTRWR